MRPTVLEVRALIATPKAFVRAMEWQPKPSRPRDGWSEFRSALHDTRDGVVVPDAMVVLVYKPQVAEMPPEGNLSLLLRTHRVYAVDMQRYAGHRNKVGRGLPYFGKSIRGHQRHVWTDDGEGYAEPVQLASDSFEEAFKVFVADAGVAYPPRYVDPTDAPDGQRALL